MIRSSVRPLGADESGRGPESKSIREKHRAGFAGHVADAIRSDFSFAEDRVDWVVRGHVAVGSAQFVQAVKPAKRVGFAVAALERGSVLGRLELGHRVSGIR